jgi:hypothetical protein
LRGQRVDQHLAKVAPVDFGTLAGVAARVVEQDLAVLVDDAFGVFAGADETQEGVEEPGGFQGDLTVVFVDIEQPALRSDAGRGLGFVDRGGNAMKMQDTREDEAAKAGADDGDGASQRCAPVFADAQRP